MCREGQATLRSVREAGFSLQAATRAGAADEQRREALLKYDPWKSPTGDILRPPLSTERLLPGPDGLVRIWLKKPFSDGTVAVDLDPLSLLCRLCSRTAGPSPDCSPSGYQPRPTLTPQR
jgi:hypothetical protein